MVTSLGRVVLMTRGRRRAVVTAGPAHYLAFASAARVPIVAGVRVASLVVLGQVPEAGDLEL